MISGVEVLVVCTANVCRSPMAEALLARRMSELGSDMTVRSAGMLGDGNPPYPEVVSAMAGYGLDVSSHRSRRVTPEDLERADLTLAMARENLRHAVVCAPSVWPQSFTLRELVRRGTAIGPRAREESLAGWLARVHEGRERAALLGDSPDDDVADPAGGPWQGYAETAAVLSGLVDRLVDLCRVSALDPTVR
jgi:low molecular weight protein-tyrosine phosphatase